jgi:hypothetical protein
MISFTERALEVLHAATSAAARFDPNARVRVCRNGEGVVFELTDAPGPDDVPVDAEGVVVLVEGGLSGTVDAGEHNELVLRPGGAS